MVKPAFGETIDHTAVGRDLARQAGVARHMESLRRLGVTIVSAIWAGIAVETADRPAGSAVGASHMVKAGLMGEAVLGIGADRT